MILDEIVLKRKEQLEREIRHCDRLSMRQKAEESPLNRPSFEQALRAEGMCFICEVKKASPSKGLIRPDFQPIQIAKEYESAGAAAISCLTEEHYFQGSSAYLESIAKEVNLPILRKDFIFDAHQIYEAKVLGASALLLIAGILSQEQMGEYLELSHSLGLDCLVEVHSESELEKVEPLCPKILGINNRDLTTFHVDLETTGRLANLAKPSQVLVSESGIRDRRDICTVESLGAKAVLIGETLMRSANITRELHRLKGGADEA